MARTDTVFWVKQTADQAGMAGKVSTLERCVEDVLGMTGAETEIFALLPRTIVGNQPAGSNASATAAWIPDGTLELEYCQFAVVHMARDDIAAEPLNSSMKGGSLQFSVDGEDGLYLVAWQGRQEAAVTAALTKDDQESNTFRYGDTMTAQITVTGSGGAATGRVELRQGTAVLAWGELDGSGKATLTYTLDNSTAYGENIQLTIAYEGDDNYQPASQEKTVTFQALAPDKPVVTADPQRNAVELTWQAPDTRGTPITGYTLVVEQGGTHVNTIDTIGPDDTSYTVPNLTGGLVYTFTLTARSSAGDAVSEPVTATPLADGTEVILLPVGSGTRTYDLSALLDGAVITNVAEGADEDNLITNATADETVLTLTYDVTRDGGSADLTVTTEQGNLLLTAKAVNVAAEGDGVFWVRAIANPSYVDMDDLNQVFAAWTDAMAQHGFAGATWESFAILPRTIVGNQAPEDPGTAAITWTPSGSQPTLDEGSFLVLRIDKGAAEAGAIDYERTGDSLTFTATGEDALYAVVYKAAENGAVQVDVELYNGDTATSRFRYGDAITAQVTLTPETDVTGLKPTGGIKLYLGDPERDGILLGQSTARNGRGTITYKMDDLSVLSNEQQTLYVVYQGDNTYLAGTGTAQAYLQLLTPEQPVLQTKNGVGEVTLTWNGEQPVEGVAPITGYTLEVKGGSEYEQHYPLGADETTYTVSGLTGGQEYIFTLTAHSDAGDSLPGTAAATPLSAETCTILVAVGTEGTRDYDLSQWLNSDDEPEIRLLEETFLSGASCSGAVLTVEYSRIAADAADTAVILTTKEKELTVTVEVVEAAAEANGVFWVEETAEGADMTEEEAALTDYLATIGMGTATADTFALLPRTIVGGVLTAVADGPAVTWSDGEPLSDARIVVLFLPKGGSAVREITPDVGADALTFPAQGQAGLYLAAHRALQSAAVDVTLKKGTEAAEEFGYGDTMTAEVRLTGPDGVPTPTGTVALYLGTIEEGNLLGRADLSRDGTASIDYALNSDTQYSSDFQTLYLVYSGDINYLPGQGDAQVRFRPSSSPTYPVTVADTEHGSVKTSTKTAARERTVTITVLPEEGYELVSLTVTSTSGKEQKLTDKGDGRFAFQMPGSGVTVTAVFGRTAPDYAQCGGGTDCPMRGFTDLDLKAWYHDGVHYCLDKGMMGLRRQRLWRRGRGHLVYRRGGLGGGAWHCNWL